MNNIFHGERLRQVRIIRDMSLNDVAQQLYASKQYIHQLEMNIQKPNEMFVQALADVFEIKPSFFYRNYENRIYEGECYFRKAKSTPTHIKEKAVHCAALLEDYIVFIENEFDLPEVQFDLQQFDFQIDDYKQYTNSDIEKLTEQVRLKFGLGLDRPIDNMVRVLENNGVIVTYFRPLLDKIDAFSINRVRPIVIRNSEKENVCRQRFDLAHECGHLILHKFSEMEIEDPLKEEQANRFASAFLLPRTAFIREFAPAFGRYINWNYLFELKKRWKVSFAAIIRRAYDLGLIDAIKYRSAYIYLRKTGQMKTEKGDNLLSLEQVELLPEITSELLKNFKKSLDYFLENVGFSYDLLGAVTNFNFSSILDCNQFS